MIQSNPNGFPAYMWVFICDIVGIKCWFMLWTITKHDTLQEKRHQSVVLPLFAEEDLLQNAYLSVSLDHLLSAAGTRNDQAAYEGQRSWRSPGHPLLHGVVRMTTSHFKRLPVHHQLPLSRLAKVLNFINVHWDRGKKSDDYYWTNPISIFRY